MKRLISLLVILALGLLEHETRACGMFAVRRQEKEPPFLSLERVLLMWDSQTETEDFIRETRFDRANGSFGFVVPTPTKPEVFGVKDPPFDRLKKEYPFRDRSQEMLGGGGGAPGRGIGMAPPPVEVLSKQRIGSFTAFTLATTDAGAFDKWLTDNGFTASAESQPWLAHYVKLKFFFVALRYEGNDGGGAEMRSETMRIRFKTPHPYYPYLEPVHAPGAPLPKERVLDGWLVTREFMSAVGARSEREGTRWGSPWSEGVGSGPTTSELAAVLGPELARLAPVVRETLAVMPFRDRNVSRDGRGDVLFVPSVPMTLTPAQIEAREFLLPVLDPTLIGEGPQEPPPAPVKAAPSAAPTPTPTPAPSSSPPARSSSCAMTPARGGNGALAIVVIAGALALRRRRGVLAATLLLGCQKVDPAPVDAAPSASVSAAVAPEPAPIPPPPPVKAETRRGTALAILAGEKPYTDGFFPNNRVGPEAFHRDYPYIEVWVGRSPLAGAPGARLTEVVSYRDSREALRKCYREQLLKDPNLTGAIQLTITATGDGGVGSIAVDAPGFPADFGACVAKSGLGTGYYGVASGTVPVTLSRHR